MGPIEDAPRLAALFVIRFDQRVGYTISWSRALPGIELNGVEFKSLPSGLHNVKEDLVYFIQGTSYAGLSAFRNDQASTADRNASFACVGALVPLNGSRLGRIWLHASELKRLAGREQGQAGDTSKLEHYWEEHRAAEGEPEQQQDESKDMISEARADHESRRKEQRANRRRALSESTTLSAAAPYSFHPARSLPDLLDAFGPLLFPLYRAALLRKRILLIRKPPVQSSCDFVYLLSIISSISNDTLDAILPEAPARSNPKFSVGITEIPELEQPIRFDSEAAAEEERNDLWIACTTDELLAMKSQLYDIKVEFPGVGSAKTHQHQDQPPRMWPLMTETPSSSSYSQPAGAGKESGFIRATPRDARRFKALRQGIRRINRPLPYRDDDDDAVDGQDEEGDERPLLQPDADEISEYQKDQGLQGEVDEALPADREAVEAQPWAAIAYDSFVWWASAGERSVEMEEEDLQHRELLTTSNDTMHYGGASSASLSSYGGKAEGDKSAAAVVGYFHRWTHQMLSTLADIVEEAESGITATTTAADEQSDGPVTISVGKEELARMGLDVWSKGDKEFIKELCRLYFGIEAQVEGRSIECCGVRVM